MKIEKIYYGSDHHLDTWKDKMDGRGVQQGQDTENGLKVTWTKNQIMDFAGWGEGTYSRLSKVQKLKRLQNLGVIVHDLTGKGITTQATVTITNYAWFNLLLRGNTFRNHVAEAYMNELFIGNGFMESNGVLLAATIKEYAEKYGDKFGETVLAARNKLDRIRKVMNVHGYLLNGKESFVKQLRVKVTGSDTYLKGIRAIHLDECLRRDYADFYQTYLDVKYPIRKTDPLYVRKRFKLIRQEELIEFTNKLKKQRGLDLIRSHRTSVISDKARADYQALTFLYTIGATFTEIRYFLEERPAYWKEQEEKEKRPSKSFEEILDELEEILDKQEAEIL